MQPLQRSSTGRPNAAVAVRGCSGAADGPSVLLLFDMKARPPPEKSMEPCGQLINLISTRYESPVFHVKRSYNLL